MSDFSINFNVSASGKLDKLFEDANIENNTYQQEMSSGTSSNLTSSKNGSINVNSNGIETIDLSSGVEKSTSNNVNNNIVTNSINSNSSTTSTSSMGNLNSNSNQNAINLNNSNSTSSNITSSVEVSNSGTTTGTMGISTSNNLGNGTSVDGGNLNLDSSFDLSNASRDDIANMNSELSTGTNISTTTANGVSSSSSSTSGNGFDNDGTSLNINDIGISLNATESSDNNSNNISISSDIATDDNSSNAVTIETLEEYIQLLSSYGFTEEDINRVINGEITLEDLYNEILENEDTTRLRYLLEAQYLSSCGLEYTILEELENAINVDKIQMIEIAKMSGGEIDEAELANLYEITDLPEPTLSVSDVSATIKTPEELAEELTTYQEYYDAIKEEVDYYLNNVYAYINKSDFDAESNFNTECLEKLARYSYSISYNLQTAIISNKEDLVAVLACIINDEGGVNGGYVGLTKLTSGDKTLSNYIEWSSLMTEEEISIFNYIYNTEGYEKAYDYLTDLSDKLDARWLASQTEKDQEFASEHPVIASIGSVFVTPIEGISAIAASLNSLITNQEIMRYEVYSAGDVWRCQVATDITENYGETAGFMYSTGMSMADSLVLVGTAAATGGVGTVVISAATMGSRAYVSTLNDALDRGISDGAAVGLAFTSAVIETAMESYSVGHLLNLETTLGNAVGNLTVKISNNIENEAVAAVATKGFYIFAGALSQGLCEGEEEFCTEILNYVADYAIAKDLSNYSLTMQNYIESGMSEQEAWKNTIQDFGSQTVQAFLGGFVSGCVFGAFGGSYSTNKISENIASDIYADFTSGNSAQQFAQVVSGNAATELSNHISDISERKNQEIATFLEGLKNSGNSIDVNILYNLYQRVVDSGMYDMFAKANERARTVFNDFFKGFRDHTLAHTLLVAEYAERMATTFNEIASENGQQLVNIEEVRYAALCHDLGMNGEGYSDIKGKKNTSDFEWKNVEKSEEARDFHPLNSAIQVLTNDIVPENMRSVVALLACSHSKSTSGISSFSTREQWITAINKIESALQHYNADKGKNFTFDTQGLIAMINDESEFTRLQNEALMVRDGDAMSAVYVDENGNTVLQTENTSQVTITLDRGTDFNMKVTTLEEETSTIHDVIVETGVEITNEVSKQIHAGELNVDFSSTFDGKHYTATMKIKKSNAYLNSTFAWAIKERLGEILTYDNCESRVVNIELTIPEELGHEIGTTEVEKFYVGSIEDYIELNEIKNRGIIINVRTNGVKIN